MDRRFAIKSAETMAESLRDLNHATLPAAHALEDPADVYVIVGALAAAMGRLGQLAAQLDGWVSDGVEDGSIDADGGRDAAALAAAAHEAFVDVDRHAAAITAALNEAHEALSALKSRS